MWQSLLVGLEVRLLGPLEVTVEGKPVRVTGRLRPLLLVLAVSAGRVVSVDRIGEAMWGLDLPDNLRGSVHTNLTRLRRLLSAGVIETKPGGYLLRADAVEVDAHNFLALLDLAASAQDPQLQRQRLVEALALWRGMPFDGVPSDVLETSEAPRLLERYLAALERRVDLDIASGQVGGLTAELVALASRHPLHEPLLVRLLTVLDRSGRRAEALERYEAIRVQLAEKLGIDPGPELRAIHAELLTGGTPEPRRTPAIPRFVPRQLPVDVAGFVGRRIALRAMDGPLDQADSSVVILAIGGAAGVGKTALALHWAHRVADRFPDGQLYVNLRGFDPSGTPRAPTEVLRGFLDALQLPQHQGPSDVEAQAALYRSALAGKRMLIVLDNARDADHVRLLLPGSPGCLVVVTSRDHLASLAIAEGAHPISLSVLSTTEAKQLLDRRIGAQRISADPEAADEIISRCASLPLALTVVAARAARQPHFPLGALAAQLREATARLSVLAEPDPVVDLRAVFSWSFQTLSARAASLFRMLGLQPGPDISERAAASLLGLPLAEVRPLLAELTSASLIVEPSPGRYAFHDLLRAYAIEQSGEHDTEMDRRAATHRLLDHYVHSGHAAAISLYPQREPITLAEPIAGVSPERFSEHHQEAFQWCIAEHHVLLAMVEQARVKGFGTHAWQLAWAIIDALDRQGFWEDIVTTQLVAIAETDRLRDKAAAAQARRNIARAYGTLGLYEQAHTRLGEALELYSTLNDSRGQADTHRNICRVFELEGKLGEAIAHSRKALGLYLEIDDRVGEARVLNSLGWLYCLSAEYEPALAHCQRALRLHEAVGNKFGQASTLDSLGYAHVHLGQHNEAIACYLRSLELWRDIGERYWETETLMYMGDAYVTTGNVSDARKYWQLAMESFAELGHSGADKVRAKLQSLPG